MTVASPASTLARMLQDKLGTSDLANPAVLAAVQGVLEELHRAWRAEGERAGFQRFEEERKRRSDLLLRLVHHPAFATANLLVVALVFADRTEGDIKVVLDEIGDAQVDQGTANAAATLFGYGLSPREVAADVIAMGGRPCH